MFGVDKKDMAIILISHGVEKVQPTSSAQSSAICVSDRASCTLSMVLSVSTYCYSPSKSVLCAVQTYS